MDIQSQQGRVQEITRAYSQQRRQTNDLSTLVGTEKTESVSSSFQLESIDASSDSFAVQNGLAHLISNADFDLNQLQYQGKPILEMSQEEAADLVSEDGYFGVTKTAERLAQFVILGAGDDLDKMQAGREGIIQGFKEAEKLWGGQLPEISYTTLASALEQIDERIHGLGGAVVDISV